VVQNLDRTLFYNITMDKLHIALEKISLENAELSTPACFQHSHTSHELHYILKGSCTMSSEQQRRIVREEEFVLLPANLHHSFEQFSEDFLQFNLTFRILPPDKKCMDPQVNELYETFRKQELTVLDLNEEAHRGLRHALRQMIELAPQLNDSLFADRTRLSALSLLVIMSLYESLSGQTERYFPEETAPEFQGYQIDHFFNMNYNARSTRDELAKQLNVSPRHMTRILHQDYGMSYREKVNEKRLQTALYLISTSDKSFTEISELLGYSCPSNFNNFIKRKTGKTPTQLRRETKKEK